MTWIEGISLACGALDPSITEDSSEFCSDLNSQDLNLTDSSTGRTLPRPQLADWSTFNDFLKMFSMIFIA